MRTAENEKYLMRRRTKNGAKKRILHYLTLHFLFAVIPNMTAADEVQSINLKLPEGFWMFHL
jgi:hypothetical protein